MSVASPAGSSDGKWSVARSASASKLTVAGERVAVAHPAVASSISISTALSTTSAVGVTTSTATTSSPANVAASRSGVSVRS